MNSMKLPKKTPVAAAILTLVINTADAAQNAAYNAVASVNNNFTMITPQQGTCSQVNPAYAFGGSNRVVFSWDGTLFDSSNDYTGLGSTSNATLSSADTFFGYLWTAHTVQVFGPGTYTFDTTTYNAGANSESGILTMTVGANQIGAHMLFDWNGNLGIDVVNVWDVDSTFGPIMSLQTPNLANNSTSTVFLLASTDPDGDGIDGVPMALGGPFRCYNANFSVKGPLAFTFNDQSGVAVSTVIESTPITVTGIGAATTNNAAVTVSGGEYAVSTNGGATFGAYTSTAGTVYLNNQVKVRHTSSASNLTATNTTLMIGLHSDIFTSTTAAAVCDVNDTTPDAFVFTNQSGVALGTVIESAPITVSGICAGTNTTITVSGGEYAISTNGGTTYGAYTSGAGTVTRDDRVKVRHTSSASSGTATTTTLTIGGVNGTFTSTTILATVSNTVSMTANEPSAASGCSISPKPVGALDRADWWLVAGFLAWLGVLRMRFKRQAQS